MIRYAVVGAGWISQIAFMPGVAATGNSKITAIVSGDADKAGKLAKFHGVDHVCSYADYDRMLSADIVDAVYIALPNSMHASYAIRAAGAGKHILVEKPLAVTEEECVAMIEAADKGGVLLMTAMRLHNEPGNIEVLERIRNGDIGEPRLFSSLFSLQAVAGNHRLKAEHWGGPLQDIGIYCLNAARHAFAAEPVEVCAMKHHGEDARFAEVEEMVAATLRFPGGRLAQFCASFGAAPLDVFRVVGSAGEIALERAFDFQTSTHMRMSANGKTIERSFPHTDQFAGQTAYFSDCILQGIAPEADGAEGLADVRALLALEEAARSGRPQPVKTPPRSKRPTPDMARSFAPVEGGTLLVP